MLKIYGFGEVLISCWINILYKHPKCRIVNNNFLSNFFNVKKGVRQGDPLSPTIFILCTEYFSIMLQQSKLYKGLTIRDKRIKRAVNPNFLNLTINGENFWL